MVGAGLAEAGHEGALRYHQETGLRRSGDREWPGAGDRVERMTERRLHSRAVAALVGEPAPVAEVAAPAPGRRRAASGRGQGRLSRAELAAMCDAGAEILACQRVLAKTGDNVVSEVLRGQGTFFEWNHYPLGDVYDSDTHSQYYYHSHPESERAPGEHGHFHTFLRPLGMPPGIRPVPVADFIRPANPNDAVSHLVGISMDRAGQPIRLFTTNRWVTGETLYAAEDVVRMLDRFAIDHARPSWPVNRWITAMIRLFRPEIAELLRRRDEILAERQAAWPRRNVLDDHGLAVTSEMEISVSDRIAAVERELRAVRRRRTTSGAG